LIGINLRTFASERWNGVEKLEREEEDYKNGRTRGGIGVSKSEAVSSFFPSSPSNYIDMIAGNLKPD